MSLLWIIGWCVGEVMEPTEACWFVLHNLACLSDVLQYSEHLVHVQMMQTLQHLQYSSYRYWLLNGYYWNRWYPSSHYRNCNSCWRDTMLFSFSCHFSTLGSGKKTSICLQVYGILESISHKCTETCTSSTKASVEITRSFFVSGKFVVALELRNKGGLESIIARRTTDTYPSSA